MTLESCILTALFECSNARHLNVRISVFDL